MKQTIQISTLIFTLLAIFPHAAMSEVKVTLKNGREIITDRCTDSGGKLTCYKSDGTFRIDKKDVLDMKKITIERRATVEDAVPDASSPDQKKEEPKDLETGKADEKTAAKAPAGAPVGEQEKRLAEIRARRAAYEADREILIKEREQLHEEVKTAGIISTNGQYQYFQKKIYDLDVRIKAFNDKVNKLNEEISVLENGPQKKMP